MDYKHSTNIMVPNNSNWREVVARIIRGLEATALPVEEKKHGLLIRVMGKDPATLDEVHNRAIEIE